MYNGINGYIVYTTNNLLSIVVYIILYMYKKPHTYTNLFGH